MKKLAIGILCVLALAGCKEKTLDDLRAEVAAREAAKAAEEAKQAEKGRERLRFVGSDGYTHEVIKICLEGIQYYTGDIGHGAVLAPVISSFSLLPTLCEK